MAPTISSSVSEFISAITNIVGGLFNSLIAVFQAILAFFMNIFSSAIQLVQSFLKLGIDMCQGVVGFVAGTYTVLVNVDSLLIAHLDCSQFCCHCSAWWSVLFLHQQPTGSKNWRDREAWKELI